MKRALVITYASCKVALTIYRIFGDLNLKSSKKLTVSRNFEIYYYSEIFY